MDLHDLPDSLVEQRDITERPRRSCSKNIFADVNGAHTNFVIIKYSNRILIIVTQHKKIGNFYTVSLNSPQTNAIVNQGPSIYDIKCIFGADEDERLVAVRSLSERLNISTPLLLSLTVNQFDFETVSGIAKVLLENRFGQVVLGPPGSGKTTYCKAMAAILKDMGRKVAIINLDPANDALPYTAAFDISEMISVEDVMETKDLGPNGSLVFAMEYLEKNVDYLMEEIESMEETYLIMDFPGQAELYAHHNMIKNILNAFQKADIRLCSVFLVDAHYANDAGKYLSAVLLTLNSMLQMEIATVNILSKIDIIERYGKMDFNLDYYTEVMDLDYLIDELDAGPLTKKYQKLNKAIADVVTDYSLVSYIPLSVDNRSTLLSVMKAVDKANGYVYGTKEERNIQRLLSCAVGAEFDDDRFGHLREEYEEEKNEELLKMLAQQNQH